jgi:hypothetical protein
MRVARPLGVTGQPYAPVAAARGHVIENLWMRQILIRF